MLQGKHPFANLHLLVVPTGRSLLPYTVESANSICESLVVGKLFIKGGAVGDFVLPGESREAMEHVSVANPGDLILCLVNYDWLIICEFAGFQLHLVVHEKMVAVT